MDIIQTIIDYLTPTSLTDFIKDAFVFTVGTVVMLELFIVMGVIMTTYSDNLIKSGRHFLIFLLFLVVLSW